MYELGYLCLLKEPEVVMLVFSCRRNFQRLAKCDFEDVRVFCAFCPTYSHPTPAKCLTFGYNNFFAMYFIVTLFDDVVVFLAAQNFIDLIIEIGS